MVREKRNSVDVRKASTILRNDLGRNDMLNLS
jgi:hypothetical protein